MKRTVASEQFFTSVATAQKCVAAVERLFPFEQFDLIVEPSAGAGAFLQFLPISNRIGLDIAPLHADIVKQDFLAWQPREEFHTILTIGNPPYGQRAALAAKFIAHACSFSEVVAFILPQSFNKYTFQNRVPRNFHLQNSFNCDQFETPTGQQLIVKSVFQIWEKQATPRQIETPPKSHPDFTMRHAHLSRVTPAQLAELRQRYEFAIPQVGFDFAPRNPHKLTKGSYWFIKPNVDGVFEVFANLDFSFLDGMNVAHKSLARADIIRAYMVAKGQNLG